MEASMGKIHSVEKMTNNRFVNLYGVKATSVHDTPVNYFVASRAKDVDELKLNTKKNLAILVLKLII